MPMSNDIERLHGRIAELEARVAALEGVKNDEWITWNGGECPVDADTIVRVMLRMGEVWQGPAGYVFWGNTGISSEIVTYRVVK